MPNHCQTNLLSMPETLGNWTTVAYHVGTQCRRLFLLRLLYSDRRSDVPFIAVVFTNGDSNSRDLTLYEASEGRRAGITFLTVAAEPWLDRYVLSAIASFPHQHNMIIAANYSILSTSDYVRYLADAICNSQLACCYITLNNDYFPGRLKLISVLVVVA